MSWLLVHFRERCKVLHVSSCTQKNRSTHHPVRQRQENIMFGEEVSGTSGKSFSSEYRGWGTRDERAQSAGTKKIESVCPVNMSAATYQT